MGFTKARSSLATQRFPHSPSGLPVDLQYLPPDKQREPDADIRKMLIEAIMLVSRASAAKVSPPTETRLTQAPG